MTPRSVAAVQILRSGGGAHKEMRRYVSPPILHVLLQYLTLNQRTSVISKFLKLKAGHQLIHKLVNGLFHVSLCLFGIFAPNQDTHEHLMGLKYAIHHTKVPFWSYRGPTWSDMVPCGPYMGPSGSLVAPCETYSHPILAVERCLWGHIRYCHLTHHYHLHI